MPETDARKRMIRSAALLIRERGVEATSFADVIAHSGAPRGSIYHHFPGGKAQLVDEATRWAADVIARAADRALAEGGVLAALEASLERWRHVLTESDFVAGCPVVAVTVEADQVPAARVTAGDAFRRWVEPYAEALTDAGVPEERARSLATLVIASLEGAILLSRAQRSLAPLEHVGAELRTALEDALAAART